MLFAVGRQCACMVTLAGSVAEGSKVAGIVTIIMLFLFNIFFAVGLVAIFRDLCLLSTRLWLSALVLQRLQPPAIESSLAVVVVITVSLNGICKHNIVWNA